MVMKRNEESGRVYNMQKNRTQWKKKNSMREVSLYNEIALDKDRKKGNK